MLLQRSESGWRVDTPSKINLFFEVLGKRNDNFHEIVSIAAPIQLTDTLTFNATSDPHIHFRCIGGSSDVPLDDANLVVRAATLLQQRYHVSQGAAITLTKRIPSQAGLGGGSSDASATLRLASRAWHLDVPDSELRTISAEIGSDCPIFFYDGPTIRTGRGDRIRPLPPIPPLWVVLLKPPEGLSTASVYAECMPLHDGDFRQPDDLLAALSSGDVRAIGQHLFNRLEVPAQKLWHRFGEIREQLLAAGCLAVQMCGSGTAFFGLCNDESHANEVLQRVSSRAGDCVAVCTARK
jgi:4-diphosphocytidyl-2-C-methyl-D-erythritol kinase